MCRYSSTNIQRALSQAVTLRPPSYAFPVHDLDLLTSVDKYRGEAAGVLRDCVSLQPGTTVEQLYVTMVHYPTCLAAGDFIRAEASGTCTHSCVHVWCLIRVYIWGICLHFYHPKKKP